MAVSSFISIIESALKVACFNRFSSFLGLTDSNKDIVFFPKSLALRKIAEKRGENTVEFMSLWRADSMQLDWGRQRTPLARKGVMMQYNSSGGIRGNILTIKAVPIKMSYTLHFWSKDLDKINNALQSYFFWYQDSPNLVLYYGGLFELDLYMKFGPVVDETNYDIYNVGQYFVSSMPIELEGWILSSFNYPTILKIVLDVYLREGVSPNFKDTLIEEYEITSN
jgi:hypothetical protein